MKYILLLRHAKSSHNDSSLKDFDRPLASRGRRDAPRMGHFLKEIDMLPGHIVSSTARRAHETTELFSEGAGIDAASVHWSEELYYGASVDYLEAIRQADNESNTVLLVGHNPKVEDVARRLCGGGAIRMPTAALVCLEQPAREWKQVREGMASLKWMMIPRLLKKIDDG